MWMCDGYLLHILTSSTVLFFFTAPIKFSHFSLTFSFLLMASGEVNFFAECSECFRNIKKCSKSL